MATPEHTPTDHLGTTWRDVSISLSGRWRFPTVLESTGVVTSGLLVATVTGLVPEGPAALGTAGAFVLHSVASLITRCVRVSRERAASSDRRRVALTATAPPRPPYDAAPHHAPQ